VLLISKCVDASHSLPKNARRVHEDRMGLQQLLLAVASRQVVNPCMQRDFFIQKIVYM
jgi:hypothetical protein